MKKVISGDEAGRTIEDLQDGRFFTVVFVKRTTGELRVMNCRQGVRCHLKGGKAAYRFSEKRLVSVWDVKAEGYRSFGLEALVSITVEGQEYFVDHSLVAANV